MPGRERDAVARSPGSVRCDSRAAGHAVHPVHLRLCRSGPGDAWAPMIIMGAVGDVVTLASGAELLRYRNHDAPGLLARAAGVGADALLNLRYGLLFLRGRPGDPAAVFSLQPAGHLPHPCTPATG